MRKDSITKKEHRTRKRVHDPESILPPLQKVKRIVVPSRSVREMPGHPAETAVFEKFETVLYIFYGIEKKESDSTISPEEPSLPIQPAEEDNDDTSDEEADKSPPYWKLSPNPFTRIARYKFGTSVAARSNIWDSFFRAVQSSENIEIRLINDDKFGVFAKTAIPEKTVLRDLDGWIRFANSKKRIEQYPESVINYRIADDLVAQGILDGSLYFVRHRCLPSSNAEYVALDVGMKRMSITTTRAIQKDEEILVNYTNDFFKDRSCCSD